MIDPKNTANYDILNNKSLLYIERSVVEIKKDGLYNFCLYTIYAMHDYIL